MLEGKVLVVKGALPGSKVSVRVNGSEFMEMHTPKKYNEETIQVYIPKNSNNVTITVNKDGILPFQTTFVIPAFRKYNCVTTTNTKDISL